MDQQEIKERVEEIEKIYATYLDKLLDLKKEQDKIIADFEEVLRSERLKEVKKTLGII
jgi:lipopolysaccharide biosynthesis regulator YciM